MNDSIADILGESSPKRRVDNGISMKSIENKITPGRTVDSHLDLGDYDLRSPDRSYNFVNDEGGWKDEEVYNSSRLSPIGADGKEYHELEKVTSFTPQKPEPKDVKADQGGSLCNFEADHMIQRVKQFIEGKRKDLDEKKKFFSPQKEIFNGATAATDKTNDRFNHNQDLQSAKLNRLKKHQRYLRRLIQKIHKEPYESEWSIVEWQLFQHYLNEWKLSGDDKMFYAEVLKDLFNCSIEELEARAKSLKKLVYYKRKIVKPI